MVFFSDLADNQNYQQQLWAAATYSRLRMLSSPHYLRQLQTAEHLRLARQAVWKNDVHGNIVADDEVVQNGDALKHKTDLQRPVVSPSPVKRKRKNSTPLKHTIKRPWEDDTENDDVISNGKSSCNLYILAKDINIAS